MSAFTYSMSCSRSSALLPVYLGLAYKVSLVILSVLTRPDKVILKTVLSPWQLGCLVMCLSSNTRLLLYTDGASIDHWAVRTFVLVHQDHYNMSVSAILDFLSLCCLFLLFTSIPIISIFLYIVFAFHYAVNAGVGSTHRIVFPLFSLKLIYLVSSALTLWCLGRG